MDWNARLWNVFTCYTLQGDPLQPNLMRGYEFTKFAQDCGALDAAGAQVEEGEEEKEKDEEEKDKEEAKETAESQGAVRPPRAPSVGGRPRLCVADLNVIVAYETSKAKAASHKQKRLGYQAFLNAVMKVAHRLYPDEADGMAGAFKRFVECNVLPRAKARVPADVRPAMDDRDVQALLRRFETALQPIFEYYASSAERKPSERADSDASKSHARGRGRGRARSRASSASSASSSSSSSSSSSASAADGGHCNSMVGELRHVDFLNLCKDFGLSNSALLSTQAIGDVFLSSIDGRAFHKHVPKLTFEEFLEALVRCSLLVGRRAHASATQSDKLKSLFLIMWKSAHQRGNVTKAIESHIPKTVNAAALLAGIMTFNNRFTELWAKDAHKDYLAAPPVLKVDAYDVLQSLCLQAEEAAAASAMA